MTKTNKVFSETDKTFIASCEVAKVLPTKRQASKYRNKKGSAYKFKFRPKKT